MIENLTFQVSRNHQPVYIVLRSKAVYYPGLGGFGIASRCALLCSVAVPSSFLNFLDIF